MNPSNSNQRRQYNADPPKSDGGSTTVFKDEMVQNSSLPRVSSYDCKSVANLPCNINNRRPHRQRPIYPSTVIPGTDPHLFARHTRHRGAALEDSSHYASLNGNDKNCNNNASTSSSISDRIPTPILVILWYSFGVVSISTSKIILSTYQYSPLLLTLQQLVIGMLLLRTLLHMQTKRLKHNYDDEHALQQRIGLQPVPLQSDTTSSDESGYSPHRHNCEVGIIFKRKSSNEIDPNTVRTNQRGILSMLLALAFPSSGAVNNNSHHRIHNHLLLSSIYFTIGFLLTNYGFRTGSAAFVETVKAAEPITSAATAVLWGIERLVLEEVISLGGIIVGVVLSTLGHRGISKDVVIPSPSQPLLTSTFIVLLSNLCFSFRGLHQKLFRATPQGKVKVVNDLNLQYRMQQIGFLLLSIPAVLGNTSFPSRSLHYLSSEGVTLGYLLRCCLLCIVNGFAFASYNLSSTTILTRISVVHHAALNCIRRVFAIIVTSIFFGLQITFLQIVGIFISVAAFFSYIYFKSQKSLQQSRRREMKKKWGGLILDAKRSKYVGKTSSSLPMGSED